MSGDHKRYMLASQLICVAICRHVSPMTLWTVDTMKYVSGHCYLRPSVIACPITVGPEKCLATSNVGQSSGLLPAMVLRCPMDRSVIRTRSCCVVNFWLCKWRITHSCPWENLGMVGVSVDWLKVKRMAAPTSSKSSRDFAHERFNLRMAAASAGNQLPLDASTSSAAVNVAVSNDWSWRFECRYSLTASFTASFLPRTRNTSAGTSD